MPTLEDYLFALDPAPDAVLAGSGLVAIPVETAATGVCGVVTQAAGLPLPVPGVAAAGSWPPLGLCLLPVPQPLAAAGGWHPAWGAVALPQPDGLGAGSVPAVAQAVLTPLFALSRAGASGRAALGLSLAAVSGFNRSGQGALWLLPPTPRGHVCSLDSPAGGGAVASAAVTALLGRDDPDLAAVVAGLPAGDPDAMAGALLAVVAGRIAYVADAGGDVWRCAVATLARGSGDCEDGAVLLHALLLAAGLPVDRIVTAFGRVGVDRSGHAWVAWRRLADDRWTVLDWTLGPGQGAVSGLPVLGDPGPYAWVDYALTAGAFFVVRQEAGVFFARAQGQAGLPALTGTMAGSLGLRGAVSLPGGVAAWGLAGAGGAAALAVPGVAASGRFGWGRAGLAAWTARALGAARAGGALAALRTASLAGGGGLAGTRLPRPDCAGLALTAALAAAACPLARLAGKGRGLAGGCGGAACGLPCVRVRGRGLGGGLGQSGIVLPCALLLGRGGLSSLGGGAAALDGWRAAGLGRSPEAALPDSRGDGEEWA
ncbi:transglutaminase domain-containing protein [Solidesulfovibrio sp.]